MNNKGADQTAHMHRLVCAFVVRKPRKTGFLASRPTLLFIRLLKLCLVYSSMEAITGLESCASGDIFRQLITFANRLDLDQDRETFGLGLDPTCQTF